MPMAMLMPMGTPSPSLAQDSRTEAEGPLVQASAAAARPSSAASPRPPVPVSQVVPLEKQTKPAPNPIVSPVVRQKSTAAVLRGPSNGSSSPKAVGTKGGNGGGVGPALTGTMSSNDAGISPADHASSAALAVQPQAGDSGAALNHRQRQKLKRIEEVAARQALLAAEGTAVVLSETTFELGGIDVVGGNASHTSTTPRGGSVRGRGWGGGGAVARGGGGGV